METGVRLADSMLIIIRRRKGADTGLTMTDDTDKQGEGKGTTDTMEPLVISIPYSQYRQLESIAMQFKQLLDQRTRLIHDFYKDRIEHLEQTVVRLEERQRKLVQLD